MKPETDGWMIFTEASVLRMLARGKFETRRLPKHQPPAGFEVSHRDGRFFHMHPRRSRQLFTVKAQHVEGDVVYVREPHWRDSRERDILIYAATPEWHAYSDRNPPVAKVGGQPYRSDNRNLDGTVPTREECRRAVETNKFWSRVQAMLMPKWGARLHLRIAEVRLERLQLITGEGCVAEGVRDEDVRGFYTRRAAGLRAAYARVWDELHPKQPYASDPHVLVYRWEFIEEGSQLLSDGLANAA